MKLKTCFRCNKEFDPTQSKYLCGYGKCSKCCLECGHRNYPNPDYKENAANKKNKKALDGFFSSL